jgi:hypothetical protein
LWKVDPLEGPKISARPRNIRLGAVSVSGGLLRADGDAVEAGTSLDRIRRPIFLMPVPAMPPD